MRMRQRGFVEVVDVCDAEVEWGQEDEVRERDAREEMDGDDGGAEDEFFCYRALERGVSGWGKVDRMREEGGELTATYVRHPVGVSSASIQ